MMPVDAKRPEVLRFAALAMAPIPVKEVSSVKGG